METTTRCHRILALIGIGALVAYIVACRASFSPDGSRILFPSGDPDRKSVTIALHDRNTGKTENLLAVRCQGDEGTILSARWSPDGTAAIILWPETQGEDHLHVMVLPVNTRTGVRFFTLAVDDDPYGSLIVPPPIIGRHLFLGGEGIVRLDLETGDIKTEKLEKEILLTDHGDQVYYATERKAAESGYEIGRLDPETLARSTILEVDGKDTGEIGPFLAISKDGRQFALVSENGHERDIIILAAKEPRRKIPVVSDGDPCELGNLQWSPDGKTFYVAFAKKLEAEPLVHLGVMEVPADGGAVRRIPIFTTIIEDDEKDETIHMGPGPIPALFQIALSPDGKTIAAPSTYLDVNDEDRALYLVDLTSPERKVTRIPIPAPAKAASSDAKK